MSLEFIVRGERVEADALLATAPRKRARTAAVEQVYHRGWRVLGHKPGEMAEAQLQRERDRNRWRRMSASELAQARARGEREPPPWEESAWRRTSRLHAVRSKPYSVPAAADECLEMARRAGWEDLVIECVSKGEAAASLFV